MAAVTITVLRWHRCLRETWLYAGTSEYPTLLALNGSDNALGADNQQERLRANRLVESSETICQAPVMSQVKIESELHGDMQRLAEMTDPLT